MKPVIYPIIVFFLFVGCAAHAAPLHERLRPAAQQAAADKQLQEQQVKIQEENMRIKDEKKKKAEREDIWHFNSKFFQLVLDVKKEAERNASHNSAEYLRLYNIKYLTANNAMDMNTGRATSNSIMGQATNDFMSPKVAAAMEKFRSQLPSSFDPASCSGQLPTGAGAVTLSRCTVIEMESRGPFGPNVVVSAIKFASDRNQTIMTHAVGQYSLMVAYEGVGFSKESTHIEDVGIPSLTATLGEDFTKKAEKVSFGGNALIKAVNSIWKDCKLRVTDNEGYSQCALPQNILSWLAGGDPKSRELLINLIKEHLLTTP